MEFEANKQTDTSPDITDAQRIDASTRRVVVEPIHSDIEPDEASDEYVANKHIHEVPIANVDGDTEVTAPVPQSAATAPRHTSSILLVASLVATALLVTVAYFYLTRT